MIILRQAEGRIPHEKQRDEAATSSESPFLCSLLDRQWHFTSTLPVSGNAVTSRW
ncbi:hypothetical protein [Prevotella sp. KH2C16]|uniref:hypothetical protein n=1 Tax=Prevotella sp. KH2C16 TaxID=1855325 RepID=UPI0015A613BE|nr:hypothetical protein [Prevotella sp. KH2C16]